MTSRWTRALAFIARGIVSLAPFAVSACMGPASSGLEQPNALTSYNIAGGIFLMLFIPLVFIGIGACLMSVSWLIAKVTRLQVKPVIWAGLAAVGSLVAAAAAMAIRRPVENRKDLEQALDWLLQPAVAWTLSALALVGAAAVSVALLWGVLKLTQRSLSQRTWRRAALLSGGLGVVVFAAAIATYGPALRFGLQVLYTLFFLPWLG